MRGSPIAPTREEQLLLLCARTRPDAGDEWNELQQGIQWEVFLDLAKRHGVLAVVASNLLRMNVVLPRQVFGALERHFFENTARNIHLTRQLKEVVGALEANGVPAVAFKGPALAASAYGHPGTREFSDLDVLVEPRLVSRASAQLRDRGYTPAGPQVNSLDGWFPSSGSEHTLLPPNDHWVPVEIQSRPWKWPMALHLDTADLIDRRQTMNVSGVELPCLSAEDQALVVAIHGLYHGWEMLRLVADMHAAASLPLDWTVVFQRARNARAERILSTALLLANRTLGVQSGPALQYARRDRVAVDLAAAAARRLFAPPHPLLAHPLKDWIRLRSRELLGDKIRYCVRTLTIERVVAPLDWVKHRASTARAHESARG